MDRPTKNRWKQCDRTYEEGKQGAQSWVFRGKKKDILRGERRERKGEESNERQRVLLRFGQEFWRTDGLVVSEAPKERKAKLKLTLVQLGDEFDDVELGESEAD